ncbi:MAG TPA: hypothetical protein VGK13_01635 [Methanocellaceae archaeon]
MAKEERHMVHPLTFNEIHLQDGRVLVFKEPLKVPLERRHDNGIVWYASNEDLGIQSYSHDVKVVKKDIEDQFGMMYLAYVESTTSKTESAKRFTQKLKDMVSEIRVEREGMNI